MHHPKVSSLVTRRVWGSTDAILLFFAGGSAEFAAIKAVDWLFFTGRLPDAPIERLFETVQFAQRVFLCDPTRAAETIDEINRIHQHLEAARGQEIPQWAYRDVLFILIYYGERAHEIVYGPMSEEERSCHLEAILALGRAMDLSDLPTSYAEYKAQRHRQLLEDYERSPLTDELYVRYREALGPWRSWLLRVVQASVLPAELRQILGLKPNRLVDWLLRIYHYLPGGGDKLRPLWGVLLPRRYAKRLGEVARPPNA